MIFVTVLLSFKCFHTADMFDALAHASIWSRHVIVRNNLFGLFAYSLLFAIFSRIILVASLIVNQCDIDFVS